ncbi:O-antigen ligase family protein [Candidatus Enterococcus ferrettii]|uniref:O-antigen ligase-related domain-containing protein n=1 Tax=Candidatus Enterococcus ferrettii TaxID=2815324 RepID=A0ABV0EIH7_9ENTE
MEKVRTLNFNWLIWLMIVSSSMIVIQFSGRTLFLFLQIIFCLVVAIGTSKIAFFRFKEINLIFIFMLVTALSAWIGDLPDSYKKAALVVTVYMIPMYFSAAYVYMLMKRDNKMLSVIVRAIKLMCLIQIVWVLIQYVLHTFFGIDINQILFTDVFRFVENASFYRNWVYYPSGLTWHSAVLAPAFVLAIVLFDSLPIRFLALVAVFLCGNSTAVVGAVIAILLLIIYEIGQRKVTFKFRVSTIISIFGLLIVGGIVLYQFNIFEIASDRIVHLWVRLMDPQSDSSTSAHLGYYSDYLKVLNESPMFQALFGYGEGTSGYPITVMYNRYTTLGNWSVESDIINLLISRGIVGFVLFYYFIFYIALKGMKIDFRYFVVVVSIFVQGFGYNVQWDYVFFLEILMFCSIKLNLNFFESYKLVKTNRGSEGEMNLDGQLQR